MNRNELVDSVADKAGLSKSQANKAVEAVFEAISGALHGGTEVRLVGFGTFSVASRAASEGRNPESHEEFMEKIVKFNQIKLPELPPGHKYVYDPATEQLMVERPKRQ